MNGCLWYPHIDQLYFALFNHDHEDVLGAAYEAIYEGIEHQAQIPLEFPSWCPWMSLRLPQISRTNDAVLHWHQPSDILNSFKASVILWFWFLRDNSLKLFSKCIQIGSIRNSSGDTYEKQETRFFLICITCKVNKIRVSETRNPGTRILRYL